MSILAFRGRTPAAPQPQATPTGDRVYTVHTEDLWMVIQVDPNPKTRAHVGQAGPYTLDGAYDIAAEQANRADGWLYGIQSTAGGEVRMVDPGDYSYLDDDNSGEQVAA